MASGKPASGEDSLIARYFKPLATDPGAFGLGGLREGGVEDRAGRDPGEDALTVEQLTHPAYGVSWTDRESGVDHGLVVELGDEALVDVPQRVDPFAVAWLGGDDLHAGHLFAQILPGAAANASS